MTTREQLHQLIDQLSEAEAGEILALLRGRRSAAVPYDSLSADTPDPGAIMRPQQPQVVTNLEDWRADFWPEDESADDVIAAVREWRSEGKRAG